MLRPTTDCETVLDELGEWISQMDELDENKTFLFRYRRTGDDIKSDFRESSVAQVLSSAASRGDPVKPFLEFDREDRLVGVFCLAPSRLNTIMEALRKTPETLSTLHFALRCELCKEA